MYSVSWRRLTISNKKKKMTTSRSSHREACRHHLQGLQTAWHDVRKGRMYTASHWEIAVRLVMGHDEKLQNVQTTHHRGGRQLLLVCTRCVERTTMWYSQRSMLRPAHAARLLSRPSWPLLKVSRLWGLYDCLTGQHRVRCCDHGVNDNAELSTCWLDLQLDLTIDRLVILTWHVNNKQGELSLLSPRVCMCLHKWTCHPQCLTC